MQTTTLKQGDCLELMKELPAESVDLVVTSPPYNKHSNNRHVGHTDSWQNAKIDYGVYVDDMAESDYQEWQKKVLRECIRVLKDDGSLFYNHKPRIVNHKIIFPNEWLGEFNIRQMIIWNRKNSPTLEPIRFLPTTEYIYWITKKAKTPKFNREAMKYTEVWNITATPNSLHPAPFPKELVKRCILATTSKNDVVLDPFMGSGTTGVACVQLNRNFIGYEISPDYFKIAEKRISEAQAQKKLGE